MLRYELLLLTVPEITEDESKHLESQLDRMIKAAKGSLISYERWGKYRLAYTVNKNEYGVYYLLRFEVDAQSEQLIQEMRSLFAVKFNDLVMRYMLHVLDSKGSLAYQRPPSLEETPRREGPMYKEDRHGGRSAYGADEFRRSEGRVEADGEELEEEAEGIA